MSAHNWCHLWELYLAVRSKVGLLLMVHQSRSGLSNLECISVSKESVHVDRRVRLEVHKEAPWPPSPRPQGEQPATNTDDPLHPSRERE